MYERSAIVLEKYFNGMFGLDKKINLKTIYKDYKEIIEELQKYQSILEEEEKIINGFDEAANEIRKIQKEQKKIYKYNIDLEGERNQLFDSLGEEPDIIENKLKNIEENIDKNNKRLEELREDFIRTLTEFSDKQKERNKYSRSRRTEEKNYLQIVEICNNDIKEMNVSILKNIKKFQGSEDENYKQEIIQRMIDNGKDERVPFDKNVIENAVNIRNEIAKKEAECYAIIYDRMKRLLAEVSSDEIKLDKYKKTLRDISMKLAFLKAQKMYIISFLDNERMTAINGINVHKKLMLEACKNLELDMEQFNNLYELILKEISGKATKKAYKELYNKEYLKNIEEKERSFQEEINSIKIKAGAILNSNYWRIEEIKNIYQVFQDEVSEKFEKDLSEFKLEVSEQDEEIKDDIFKTEIPDDDVEYIEEYEEDDDDYEDNDDYDEDDEEYNDYDEEANEEYDDEYDDEEYEDDDEYDDDYDEEDDEEYDDDEYDDDEYDEEDDEEYDDDDYDEEDDDENVEEQDEDDEQEDTKKATKKQNRKGKGLFKFF